MNCDEGFRTGKPSHVESLEDHQPSQTQGPTLQRRNDQAAKTALASCSLSLFVGLSAFSSGAKKAVLLRALGANGNRSISSEYSTCTAADKAKLLADLNQRRVRTRVCISREHLKVRERKHCLHPCHRAPRIPFPGPLSPKRNQFKVFATTAPFPRIRQRP